MSDMRVLRAEVLGMCFGVRDALQIMRELPNPEQATVHGELVHNQVVLTELRVRGFGQVREEDRQELPSSPTVVVTAHGISDRERQRLLDAGKQLVDTTCPLVKRVHLAARKLQKEGFHVLVVGKRGHVEVQGIIEDLDSYTVISDFSEVQEYPFQKLGIISQSTTSQKVLHAMRAEIVTHNPDATIHFIDTTCQPTRQHQSSLEELLPLVEAVVVVGGHTSNNTKELAQLARRHGLPAFHVQDATELREEWFAGVEKVGLTAGTSTLDETINEVEQWLLKLEEAPAPSRRSGSHQAVCAV
jgi:4-hydroxy-3-methylbut-2-en-1-yl diphosphate reductase